MKEKTFKLKAEIIEKQFNIKCEKDIKVSVPDDWGVDELQELAEGIFNDVLADDWDSENIRYEVNYK